MEFRFRYRATPFFVSCEPLTGPVDLQSAPLPAGNRFTTHACDFDPLSVMFDGLPLIGWVIAGGESGGPEAREMKPAWPRLLRDQCSAAGVPFFFKQWGEWAPTTDPAIAEARGVPLETCMSYVGKKEAGCWLDGVAHKEFPQFA
jgi:hypothetical protein